MDIQPDLSQCTEVGVVGDAGRWCSFSDYRVYEIRGEWIGYGDYSEGEGRYWLKQRFALYE